MKRVTPFNSRGESVVVSYVLVLGILTVLSALLISTAGGFLETKNEQVTKTQAEITTEAIAAELEEVDKNARRIDANSSSTGHYRYESEADDFIGQYPYRVFLESHPEPNTYSIRIEVQSVDVTETTNVTLYTIDNVETGVVSSGSSLTYLYETDGNLTLGGGDLDVESFAVNTTGDFTIPSDDEFDGGIKTRGGGSIYQGENSIIYGPLVADGSIDTEERLIVFGRVTADNTVNFGQNVSVTQSVTAGGSVQAAKNTTIGGSVDSGGSVVTGQDTTVQGNINSDNNVGLNARTTVGGNIDVQTDLVTASNTTIQGSVNSGNNVGLAKNTTVKGSIDTDVDLSVAKDAVIEGSVTAGNNVVINTRATIGSIDAGAGVGIGPDATVNGQITAVTNVQLAQQSTVNGDVTTGDDVTLNTDSSVDGTIDADTVTLNDNTQVTGDVIVPSGSDLVCSGTGITINGQTCSNYKSANY